MQDSSEALLLLFRLVLNFALLLLPVVAICFAAMRRGIRNTVQLGAIALAATAINGYCVFWSWFLSWRLVRPLGAIFEAAALLYILYSIFKSKQLERGAYRALRPLVEPAALVFTCALLILGATYAYGGLSAPFVPARTRFSHELPDDAELPYLLANSMMKTQAIPKPLTGDWRASDRPPLQTAIVLGHFFALSWHRNISYEVLAVILQSLWIFALWLLLYATDVRQSAIRMVLTGCLFSNFIFVNSAFVWPKLLAATYLLGFLALLVGSQLRKQSQAGVPMAITAGCLLAWSMLSHGGTIFALFGVIPLVLFGRKTISIDAAALCLVTAGLLYFPWMLFQKFVDPPGDRLVKMHVAGVTPIDSRPALQTIQDSYHAISMKQIAEYKQRNLRMIFGAFQFWPLLRDFLFHLPESEPLRSQSRLKLAKDINASQFFYLVSTLEFYVLGIPLLLVGIFPRWRLPEWRLAARLLLFSIVADIFWALIMFGPDATVIHQGAYATVIATFTAAILGLWMLSRWLAAALITAQVSLFTYIHVFLLVPFRAKLQYGMTGLVVVALAGIIYLLLHIRDAREGYV